MTGVPEPTQLVAAIEREHAGREIAVRLEAALRVAAELRTSGDELIDHYVHAARGEGRSWTEIGDVLGISKQGAQKRFAAAAAAAPVEPWPAGFGPDGQAVFARGAEEARALGHRYVGTEHLLLALFCDRAGLAASCLARLRISREQAEHQVLERIGRGENPPVTTLGITPRTKRVFEHARREARRLGHRCPQAGRVRLGIYPRRGRAPAAGALPRARRRRRRHLGRLRRHRSAHARDARGAAERSGTRTRRAHAT